MHHHVASELELTLSHHTEENRVLPVAVPVVEGASEMASMSIFPNYGLLDLSSEWTPDNFWSSWGSDTYDLSGTGFHNMGA
jgi:hypothetical protein